MPELNDELEDLAAMTPEWRSRAAKLGEVITMNYEEKQKRAAMWTWIGTAVGVGLMFMGVAGLIAGVIIDSAVVAITGAMMFLFGDGWITGSKLLYWTWNSRIRLERDIKEVHCDVLNLDQKIERIEAALSGMAAPHAQ